MKRRQQASRRVLEMAPHALRDFPGGSIDSKLPINATLMRIPSLFRFSTICRSLLPQIHTPVGRRFCILKFRYFLLFGGTQESAPAGRRFLSNR
jgi:hypothetical protein